MGRSDCDLKYGNTPINTYVIFWERRTIEIIRKWRIFRHSLSVETNSGCKWNISFQSLWFCWWISSNWISVCFVAMARALTLSSLQLGANISINFTVFVIKHLWHWPLGDNNNSSSCNGSIIPVIINVIIFYDSPYLYCVYNNRNNSEEFETHAWPNASILMLLNK